MHWQTASKLLHDAFCFNVNKKEHEKYIITPCIPKNIHFDDKKNKKAAFIRTKR